MSSDEVRFDFVLVRGPASLDRRLHVRLPLDGTPITVGRGPHCTTLLDPSLLFSSQVQCSLFAMRRKAPASPAPPVDTPTPAHTTTTSSSSGGGQHQDVNAETPDTSAAAGGSTTAANTCSEREEAEEERTPVHQASRTTTTAAAALPQPSVQVYITDLCSSNGTFVNGLRIGGTDPTELQHGDVCIFGGMRDVAEGEALPADAYNGPELVLWRVDLEVGQAKDTHAFDFTATPLVLPAQGVLEAEVRALMATAQRSLPKPRRERRKSDSPDRSVEREERVERRLSITPAADHLHGRLSATGAGGSIVRMGWGEVVSADRGDSPQGVPQQLFASPSSRDTETAEENCASNSALLTLEKGAEGNAETERRRSVSLVATASERDGASSMAPAPSISAEVPVPAFPPAAVVYAAVRLGNVTFVAPAADGGAEATEKDVDEKEEGPHAKRARCEGSPESCTTPGVNVVHDGAPSLTLLTCTPTHLKWTMTNPNELLLLSQQSLPPPANAAASAAAVTAQSVSLSLQKKPFFGMLPVTSVATVVACAERRGLAVELRDGCQLPLVDAAVLSGAAESRWVVWALSDTMTHVPAEGEISAAGASSDLSCSKSKKKAKAARGGGGRSATVVLATEKEVPERELTGVSAATPEERFEAWLQHFEHFYRAQGVPAPHLVDAATFDLIFAPPHSPVKEAE